VALITVIGASGFVGGYTLRAVRAQERAAIGVSRQGCLSLPGVTPHRVAAYDDESTLKVALRGADAVLYVAGRAHRGLETRADQAECERANRAAPVIAARISEALGVRRFVYLSSIAVHGSTTNGRPALSPGSPYLPENAYGLAKVRAEQELQRIAERGALSVVCVRPPLVYAHDAPGNFGQLLRWVARGYPLPFGSLHARRSYIAAENLADVLVAACVAKGPLPFALTVADDACASVRQVVSWLALGLRRSGKQWAVSQPLVRAAAAALGRSAMADRLCFELRIDNRLAREVLNWRPRFDLETGLVRAAQRHREARGTY
jgi:nucleoside-diphosphate-sugar epimerase